MKVALYTHPQKDAKLVKIEKIAERITSLGGIAYFGLEAFSMFNVSEQRKAELENCICFIPDSSLGACCDLMICVGGDGTILRAAKISHLGDIPLVGVNSGRIGYMAELEESELERVFDVITGKTEMVTETRMMLEVSVIRNNCVIYTAQALNEAVVSKGVVSRILDLELFCDGRSICNYRADGVIASTPTGSTAYAMSAGGPIIDPSIECILTVPVCAYLAINSSPVIFSQQSVVEVLFRNGKGNSAYLSIDGDETTQLEEGDIIRIKKSKRGIKFLKFRNIDFYKLLNLKLKTECGANVTDREGSDA